MGKRAKCQGCTDERAIEPLGYVPLRDQTGRPVCVVVRKERIAFVGNMPRGASVTYGRDEGRFEGVYVIPREGNHKWENYFSHPPADDMGYWLPLFLGVPELAPAIREFFRVGQCQPVVTDDAAPLPPALVDVVPAPITARGEGHAARVNKELDIIEGMIKGKVAKMRREDAEKNGAH